MQDHYVQPNGISNFELIINIFTDKFFIIIYAMIIF